jgi:hypothetical protein
VAVWVCGCVSPLSKRPPLPTTHEYGLVGPQVAEENATEKVKEAHLMPISPPGMLIHIYDLEWSEDGLIPEKEEDQLQQKFAVAVIPGDSPLLRVEVTGRMIEDHMIGPASHEDPVEKRGAYWPALKALMAHAQ